jgi:hypothetical protein
MVSFLPESRIAIKPHRESPLLASYPGTLLGRGIGGMIRFNYSSGKIDRLVVRADG